jgi:hypothetical protein
MIAEYSFLPLPKFTITLDPGLALVSTSSGRE